MSPKTLFAAVAIGLVLAGGTATAEAAFPGSNGKLAFTRTGDVYVIQPDGTGLRQLTSGPARDQRPVWSPDGSQIAFESDRDDPAPGACPERFCNWDVYVMQADGSGITRITTTASPDRNPSWSPDGTRLLFDRNADCPPDCDSFFEEIWVMNGDGTGQTQITSAYNPDTVSNSFDPAWSPDGAQIAFTGDLGIPTVLVMNADGSGRRWLSIGDGADLTPSWSPDSARIALAHDVYLSGQESICFAPDVWVVNPDGTGPQNLTGTPVNACFGGPGGHDPAWSPDGAKIAFVQRFDVFVMNADGTGAQNVTNDRIADSAPDWQPLPGPQRKDYKNAKRYCKALRSYLGDDAFRAHFGGKHAYRTCVRRNR